jgi:hypothetical protein
VSHGHGHDGHGHDEHGHDEHGHDQSHGHSHAIPQGGSVVFDIGDDVGALVVYLDDSHIGTEIPMVWAADPSKDVHTGVWPRRVGGDTVTAAVYPALTEGRYTLPALGGHDECDVLIVGGAVVEVDARVRSVVTV